MHTSILINCPGVDHYLEEGSDILRPPISHWFLLYQLTRSPEAVLDFFDIMGRSDVLTDISFENVGDEITTLLTSVTPDDLYCRPLLPINIDNVDQFTVELTIVDPDTLRVELCRF